MWKVVRASVVGTSHLDNTLPCQDSCYADVLAGRNGGEYLICLVSDGAGSAICGGEGAEVACVTAFSSIEASLVQSGLLSEPGVEAWVVDVRRALYKTAEANARAARDYACTLLGAVIGARNAAFFQIGDGGIVASSGLLQGVVFWPDSGPYANMTYFITDKDALDHLHVAVVGSRIDEVALFSDGLQRLALSFEQRVPHGPFFAPMLDALRKRSQSQCEALDAQLALFLGSAQVNERTDDDKTLILATRRRD